MPERRLQLADAVLALSLLNGQKLSSLFRYGEWQRFDFGELREYMDARGGLRESAEYRLVIEGASWSFTEPNGVGFGSGDFPKEAPRRDQHAHELYDNLAATPPDVQSVTVLESGRLTIALAEGFVLDIVPDEADRANQWRFMPPNDDRRFGTILFAEGAFWEVGPERPSR